MTEPRCFFFLSETSLVHLIQLSIFLQTTLFFVAGECSRACTHCHYPFLHCCTPRSVLQLGCCEQHSSGYWRAEISDLSPWRSPLGKYLGGIQLSYCRPNFQFIFILINWLINLFLRRIYTDFHCVWTGLCPHHLAHLLSCPSLWRWPGLFLCSCHLSSQYEPEGSWHTVLR